MDSELQLTFKRLSSMKSRPAAKRSRKALSLETKLDVIKRYERGERTADIKRALGLKDSTLRSIRQMADKIRESCRTSSRLSTFRVTVSRSSTMERMEKLLITWLTEQNEQDIEVSNASIKEMAKLLYDDIGKSEPPDVELKPFVASSGWLERFKVRHDFHKMKTGERTAADKFQDIFKSVVEENGYTPKQVFNLGETGLFWKRMPSKTFLSVEDKSLPKVENDRCTILLGGNATGDCRIKPLMVYHSDNPPELKGYSKTHLPVVWRFSKKGQITSTIFADYFGSQLHHELKAYCEREGLPFKILLLLDASSRYPPNLADLSSNINVLLMPAKTPALLQPVDQGIITLFKSYYHRQVFARLITDTEVDGKPTIQEFWRNFNLKMAIDVISEAWSQISEQNLNEAWRQLWPEVVFDSSFCPTDISDTRNAIVDMAKGLGFEEVDEKDVEYLIESHRAEVSIVEPAPQKVEVSNEEPAQLEDEQEKETDGYESETECVRTLSTEVLSEIFKLGDRILNLIDENDPDRERSSQVTRDFNNVLACYRELYREKMKHATHISLDRLLIQYQ